MADTIWAIVVAGGQGRRFGGAKQFETLAGRRVHEWAIDGARSVADGVVLVLPPGCESDPSLSGGADRVVAGGQSRSDSVRAGLDAVPSSAEIVLVHDAARPLASAELWRAVVSALRSGADCAVPGLQLSDTVKQVAEGVVTATLDRKALVRVQTPQGFKPEMLKRAHARGAEATDDAGLVEAIGGVVRVVPGEDSNIKITTPEDLAYAEWYGSRRLAREEAAR
ncbi:MAG TPA: 2-C-methyl-D-erythritol 4-phosphate cytidylyltransferase [Acidimicrobiales bacterium]|nr:2-C-methyl-D-erythritol 4-phosphate cytidylyltransferase [Acidimicrobiales bacterium]